MFYTCPTTAGLFYLPPFPWRWTLWVYCLSSYFLDVTCLLTPLNGHTWFWFCCHQGGCLCQETEGSVVDVMMIVLSVLWTWPLYLDSRDIYRARSAVSLLDDDRIRQFQTIPAIIFLIKQRFFYCNWRGRQSFQSGWKIRSGNWKECMKTNTIIDSACQSSSIPLLMNERTEVRPVLCYDQ